MREIIVNGVAMRIVHIDEVCEKHPRLIKDGKFDEEKLTSIPGMESLAIVTMLNGIMMAEAAGLRLNQRDYDFGKPASSEYYGVPGWVWFYERGDHFGKAVYMPDMFFSEVRAEILRVAAKGDD